MQICAIPSDGKKAIMPAILQELTCGQERQHVVLIKYKTVTSRRDGTELTRGLLSQSRWRNLLLLKWTGSGQKHTDS